MPRAGPEHAGTQHHVLQESQHVYKISAPHTQSGIRADEGAPQLWAIAGCAHIKTKKKNNTIKAFSVLYL